MILFYYSGCIVVLFEHDVPTYLYIYITVISNYLYTEMYENKVHVHALCFWMFASILFTCLLILLANVHTEWNV